MVGYLRVSTPNRHSLKLLGNIAPAGLAPFEVIAHQDDAGVITVEVYTYNELHGEPSKYPVVILRDLVDVNDDCPFDCDRCRS